MQSNSDLVPFEPEKKLEECEQHIGAELINPFGTGTYEEVESEDPDPMVQQPHQGMPSLPMPSLLELEDLVNNEHTHQNGLKSAVEVADGKHVNSQSLQEYQTQLTI